MITWAAHDIIVTYPAEHFGAVLIVNKVFKNLNSKKDQVSKLNPKSFINCLI